MVRSAYDSFADPFCYKNSFVLKNKAGLRDYDALESYELEMMTLRAQEPWPAGKFDTRHYRAIHHHWFQDVYTWAGRYRRVRTAKGGNVFCYPEYIATQMELLFARLQNPAFLPDCGKEAFISAAAKFLGELNAIHPFREGNGRTQLAFLYLLAHRAGHPVDLEKVREETMLEAMIDSFHGRYTKLEQVIGSLAD
jgi:cell filamentation protein